MDKDFLEKLESVTEWKQIDKETGQTQFSLSFSNEEDYSRLTDSDVIPALKTIAVKPESVSNNSISKAINQELMFQLSINDYSRQKVKMAIRKVLGSAEQHNKQGGLRGYLDFILKYVP